MSTAPISDHAPLRPHVAVWDPFVRISHWLLVLAFVVAYLTEDDLLTLHVWAGYVVLGTVLLRIAWGLIGTRHARFTDFVFSPAAVVSYFKQLLQGRPARYLGHNPAGGWMVIALLLALLNTTITGLVVYGAEENAGPLASWLAGSPHWLAEVAEETHEFFANLTLLLVTLHIAGVLLGCQLHRENLIRSMITGRKRPLD